MIVMTWDVFLRQDFVEYYRSDDPFADHATNG
jgi:hypothetical protein